MPLDDTLAQSETYSGATFIAAEPPEHGKDLCLVLGCDTNAIVFHRNFNHAAVFSSRDLHPWRSSGAMLYRIREQVLEYMNNLLSQAL